MDTVKRFNFTAQTFGAIGDGVTDCTFALQHAGRYVAESDYDAALAREAALREEHDALQQRLTVADHRAGEFEGLLHMSKELLTTISRHGVATKPNDWCDSFKAEVADRIEKIGAALKPAEEGEGS